MRPKIDKATRDQRMARIIELAAAGLVTAGQLAKEFGCHDRTIYRYIDALREKGVDIRGEAGVGYLIQKDQPFNFGLVISEIIQARFPGVMVAEPHAVAAATDGLAEAFAGILACVTGWRGSECAGDVIDRHMRTLNANLESMMAKALAEHEEKPEGVKGEQ